jgi:hypothetical protein
LFAGFDHRATQPGGRLFTGLSYAARGQQRHELSDAQLG